MRKYMNNHFNCSKIFKHARFVVSPEADANLDGGIQIDNADLGGGSDGIDENGDTEEESIEAIKAELARAKADNERYKNSISKLNKEKGELTKKNREMMSADQLAQEAQEERERRFAEMEKELRTNKYSKRFVSIGMNEADADAFAATIPELEDADAFFTTLGKFVQSERKSSAEEAIQNLLKSRPDINAGNGDAEKDSPAMEFAKKAVAERKANSNNNTFSSIISNYTH